MIKNYFVLTDGELIVYGLVEKHAEINPFGHENINSLLARYTDSVWY